MFTEVPRLLTEHWPGQMKTGQNMLLVATGHQGEPDALLPRIANGKTMFNVRPGDNVVISASVIPNPNEHSQP